MKRKTITLENIKLLVFYRKTENDKYLILQIWLQFDNITDLLDGTRDNEIIKLLELC